MSEKQGPMIGEMGEIGGPIGASADRRPARRSPRVIRGAVVAVIGLLSGCAASTVDVGVSVRDAVTHEPATGVRVVALVPSNNHPFSIASLLGNTKELQSDGVTDAQGRAVVQRVPGRPLRLSVLSPGWLPGCVDVDPSGAWTSAPDLTSTSTSQRQPEFRVDS